MNMADVMGGSRTAPEIMEKGIRWVRSLGCIPLTVKKELLGFCFNRVWRAIKREVLYMWANDFVDFRDVDRAWMKFTGREDHYGPFGMTSSTTLRWSTTGTPKTPKIIPPKHSNKRSTEVSWGSRPARDFIHIPTRNICGMIS